MQASSFQTLWRIPAVPRMAAAIFALGLASSSALPYLPLFAVKAAHMTPLQLGLFLTSISLCSILISTLIGRWSDRLPSRRPLVLLSLLSAACAYLLLNTTTSYPLLLLIGGLLLGTGASAFPQLFAYARVQLQPAGPEATQHGLTTLRSMFSLAWVAGPLLGAVAAGGLHFRRPVCLHRRRFRACRPAGAARRAAAPPHPARAPRRSRPRTAAPHTNPVTARQLQLIALGFVLYATALSMGSSALPLYVTQTLGGGSQQVGFVVGLCALLEIPVMLSFVLRPRRISPASMMVVGFGLLAGYVLMVALSSSFWMLALAQLLRAVAIAISAGLGMAYFQDLMPGRVGASTTLFANTSNAGSVLAGALFGGWAQLFGYHSVFGLCAALATLACGLMLYVRHGKPAFRPRA